MTLCLRTFLNTDLPVLVDIWRKQPAGHRTAARVNQATFDERVLGKPYFDASGLVIALLDDQPVGFAHAGFAPDPGRNTLDTTTGIISHLALVQSVVAEPSIFQQLIEQCLAYLRRAGAAVCYLGSRFPDNPFYLGLSGGALIPGILDSDHALVHGAQQAGFSPSERVVVLQKQLTGYRPQVDRRQMSIRRQFDFVINDHPRLPSWWDTCQLCHANVVQSALVDQRSGEPAAQALFWDMQPLSTSWGMATMGLYHFEVAEPYRRGGLGTFLVGETLREFAKDGVALVEVQLLESDSRGVQMATKLGFAPTAYATQFSL